MFRSWQWWSSSHYLLQTTSSAYLGILGSFLGVFVPFEAFVFFFFICFGAGTGVGKNGGVVGDKILVGSGVLVVVGTVVGELLVGDKVGIGVGERVGSVVGD